MHKTIKQAAIWGCLFSWLVLINCKEILSVEQPETIVDEDGAVISKSPIWEIDVTAKGYNSAFVTPVFHKDMVIVPGEPVENEGMLMALDTETGEEIWRWNDYVEGYDFKEVFSREQLNRKGNMVVYNNNNRFCAVNLDNGTTLWKEKREGSSHSSSIQIVGDHYYFPYELIKNDIRIQTLMRGSLYSSAHEKIIETPQDRIQLFGGFYGLFKASYIYTENQNTHAFMAFSENIDLFKGQNFNSYISYNTSNQTYDFEKVRIPDTMYLGVVDRPVMIGEMMMISGGHFIYGINKQTGEIVWDRKDFAGARSGGRFIAGAYKDRLFAVNVTGSRRLAMELDPFTGATKWIDVGRGGSTRPALYFLNDVLYFVSRGDERLYAYDINGGALLWKLRSPDYEGFMTMQVKEGATTDDKGMLVACSWKNAYRFEPAR